MTKHKSDSNAAWLDRPAPGAASASAPSADAASAGPTMEDELAFICGVDSHGQLAGKAFYTWKGNSPATYSSKSDEYKWGGTRAGTAGGTLTYYFDPAAHWTATEKAALASGLSMWSAVADVSFKETTTKSASDLVFKRGSDGSAYEYGPTTSHAVGTTTISNPGRSEISIDTSVPGFGPLGSFSKYGGYAVETVLHEEGHFLGLGHAGAYNGNVKAKTQQYSAYDNRMYSLMSYIEPGDKTAKYYADNPVSGTDWNGQDPTTWMPLDILAIQRLYGVAKDTPLSGGQVFGYNTNITGALKPYFDFAQDPKRVVTLWDKGTDNTLDLSGCTSKCTVNLNPGAYSSFDGLTNNLAIAYATVIDHAVGGSAADYLAGNTVADTIDGGAGNDTIVLRVTPEAIDGGAGTNTLIIRQGGHATLTDANFKNVADVVVKALGRVDLSGVGTAPASIVSKSTAGEGATIVGSAAADTITAGAGGDTIAGGGGNDRIAAGTGADTFDEMMAHFGRDTFYKADLTADTFDISTRFAADNTAAHLHFASIDGGHSTLVYGDAGKSADAIILSGVGAATAEAHRAAFHVAAATS